MWGKERTSLALRRMTNPAPPHKLKGLTGLGRSASEIIRSTSICNPNASDTKLDEAKPNPKSTEEEVGSQESKKEVIDLGHKKGNKDREETRAPNGPHRGEAALAQAGGSAASAGEPAGRRRQRSQDRPVVRAALGGHQGAHGEGAPSAGDSPRAARYRPPCHDAHGRERHVHRCHHTP